jgi:hypothetical protein
MFDFERFSSLRRLLRYTAHILRSFGNVVAEYFERPAAVRVGELTAKELARAKEYWFRQLQAEYFHEDIERLKKGEAVDRSSSIAKLQPFLDPADGLLKLRGRTALSTALESPADLPILPSKSRNDVIKAPHLIELLVWNVHHTLMHKETLSALRRFCWIPRD